MSLRRFVLIVGLILALLPRQAAALLVTYEFTSVLNFVDAELSSVFLAGETVAGSFTYDSSVTPRVGSTDQFAVFDALQSIEFFVPGYSASATGPDEVQVDNDPGPGLFDRFSIGPGINASVIGNDINGLSLNFFAVRLDDTSNTVFTTALVLPTMLNLEDFDERAFFIAFTDGTVNYFVFGNIASLTPIPEPSSMVLLGGLIVGGLAYRRFAGRKGKKMGC